MLLTRPSDKSRKLCTALRSIRLCFQETYLGSSVTWNGQVRFLPKALNPYNLFLGLWVWLG